MVKEYEIYMNTNEDTAFITNNSEIKYLPDYYEFWGHTTDWYLSNMGVDKNKLNELSKNGSIKVPKELFIGHVNLNVQGVPSDEIIYKRTTFDSDVREAREIKFEIPNDMDIMEFKMICIRLASSLGYSQQSIQKAFGKDTDKGNVKELLLEINS